MKTDCTGDVTLVTDQMLDVEINGNWLIGRWREWPEIKVEAKVFAEPSGFGINNGRVSKFWIANTTTRPRTLLLNYDRGWDVHPETAEAKAILAEFEKLG